MYCDLLPTSGYINSFELRPYRNGLLLRLPNALHNHTIPDYRDDDKLYEAYAECRRMRKYTGISYLADINREIRKETLMRSYARVSGCSPGSLRNLLKK